MIKTPRKMPGNIGCALLLVAVVGLPVAAQEPAYTNSIGMQFVLIHTGTMQVGVFQPGCPAPVDPAAANARAQATRPDRRPPDPRIAWTEADYAKCHELAEREASPGFEVKIAKPYYIGQYEVTQGQWKKVMGENPSVFQGTKVTDDGDRHPVDSVTWDEAQHFIRQLNKLERTNAYRLPTEFEWEYAGRADGSGQVAWSEIRQMAVQGIGFGGRGATPTPPPGTQMVGSKKPNAWGLSDMLGNVWEWVQDYYNEKLFPDPTPPKTGRQHVLKGCGFASDVKNCIYATHGAGPADGWDVGFRIVRDVAAK